MGQPLALIDSGADFSQDRLYRWALFRRWATAPMLMVIGLNPSTADETTDDPTVSRCIGYAKRWGFAGLRMLNAFAFRATDPKELEAHMKHLYDADRNTYLDVTSSNIRKVVLWAEITVKDDHQPGALLCAWGVHGASFDIERQITWSLHGYKSRMIPAACLGLTKSGHPKHPLYMRADAAPVPYLGDGGALCTTMAVA